MVIFWILEPERLNKIFHLCLGGWGEAMQCSLWDLCSSTKYWTQTFGSESTVLTTGPPGMFQVYYLSAGWGKQRYCPGVRPITLVSQSYEYLHYSSRTNDLVTKTLHSGNTNSDGPETSYFTLLYNKN